MNLPPPQPSSAPPWAPPASTVPEAPLTAAALFDDGAALDSAITAATEQSLTALTPTLRKAARREARMALADSLGFPLADVVARAWLHHKPLLAAAERTRSGSREVVALADHTITSAHRPQIDLTLDGAPLVNLAIGIELSVRMVGVAGVVENATLVALESGATSVTATLTIAGQQVAGRSHQFDARRLVTVDRPVVLLPQLGS